VSKPNENQALSVMQESEDEQALKALFIEFEMLKARI